MKRRLDRLGLALARRLRGGGVSVSEDALVLTSAAGYRLAATVFRPAGSLPSPAVVMFPGADHDRRAFYCGQTPMGAAEVAALGFVVVIFDPSGRGESWGPEDYGGAEHQDGVVTAVQWLREQSSVDPSRVGLVGISLGVASVIGGARVLAEKGEPVRWVIDWEGPCDQRTITANQSMGAPAMGHRSDDTAYWAPREAVRHVPHIDCGYWRLQADPDHAQPGELAHALAMMRAASSAALPWFQLNTHHRGTLPSAPKWLKPGPFAANRDLRRTLASLVR